MFCAGKFVGSQEIDTDSLSIFMRGRVQFLSGKISHEREVHSIKHEYDWDGE